MKKPRAPKRFLYPRLYLSPNDLLLRLAYPDGKVEYFSQRFGEWRRSIHTQTSGAQTHKCLVTENHTFVGEIR